jgi:broad specificity phosphatase PhoE
MNSVSPPNVDVYFVRHAESCSNITSKLSIGKITHPPLSYKGIQQAIILGINNEIIDMDFDRYYCSPSLRTIMTACLALRRKSLEKVITLYLNPYIIEHKNYFGSKDQQNSIVPKEKLKNMINYIKLWFEQKYFDNYIDHEFVHLMYDLVLLLYKYNYLETYKLLIKELLQPVYQNRIGLLNDFLNKIHIKIQDSPINKIIIQNKKTQNTNDIYNNILQFIDEPDQYTVYQEVNTKYQIDINNIISKLKDFTLYKYYFNLSIEIDDTYTIEDPNINTFIENEINKPELNNNKILCFSHGATLKRYFNFEENLQNTEIVHYNHKTKDIIRRFNNDIVINEQLVTDICGEIPTPLSIFSPSNSYKMFNVINNYFNDIDNEYDVTKDPEIDDNFKVFIEKEEDDDWEKLGGRYIDDLAGGRYKHKYLKYKHKYLNLKIKQLNS